MCVSGPCQYHAALSPLTQVNQVVDYYKFCENPQAVLAANGIAQVAGVEAPEKISFARASAMMDRIIELHGSLENYMAAHNLDALDPSIVAAAIA
jgi:hypothetical protein